MCSFVCVVVLFVCLYVCMCMCVCIHVCMYACMHACMYVCMYVCVCVCVCVSQRAFVPCAQVNVNCCLAKPRVATTKIIRVKESRMNTLENTRCRKYMENI